MTGSSVRLSKTGAFDNTSRKEYEPLGQEVLPNEPALDDQDVGAAIARPFIADEPEWKCRVAEGIGTNFFELPINCQRAQLQDLSSPLKDLLSAKTENNPNLVGAGRRQPPTLGRGKTLSAAERNRNRALVATGKYDNEADDNSFDNSIPGFVDASQSGQEDNKREKELLDEALTKVDIKLQNSKCLNALGGKKKVNAALKKINYTITEELSNDGADAETNSVTGNVRLRPSGALFSDYSQGNTPLPDGMTMLSGRFHPPGYTNTSLPGNYTKFKSDSLFRAYVLLHEIGHITGASVMDGFAQGRKVTKKDMENAAKNQARNNDNILNNCFKVTINADYGTTTNIVE